MNLGRCPICHSRLDLEALAKDEGASKLTALFKGLDYATGSALAAYIGLFRPAHRDLSNDRAIKLCEDTLALGCHDRLAIAMAQTVDKIHDKRGQGDDRPLKNHNYLKRVLESIPDTSVMPGKTPAATTAPSRPMSKTHQALRALEAAKHG